MSLHDFYGSWLTAMISANDVAFITNCHFGGDISIMRKRKHRSNDSTFTLFPLRVRNRFIGSTGGKKTSTNSSNHRFVSAAHSAIGFFSSNLYSSIQRYYYYSAAALTNLFPCKLAQLHRATIFLSFTAIIYVYLAVIQ